MWLMRILFGSVEIPVIIMGETGCGKTELVKFMAKLLIPKQRRHTMDNMITVKV